MKKIILLLGGAMFFAINTAIAQGLTPSNVAKQKKNEIGLVLHEGEGLGISVKRRLKQDQFFRFDGNGDAFGGMISIGIEKRVPLNKHISFYHGFNANTGYTDYGHYYVSDNTGQQVSSDFNSKYLSIGYRLGIRYDMKRFFVGLEINPQIGFSQQKYNGQRSKNPFIGLGSATLSTGVKF